MAPGFLIFTGAPLSTALSWDEGELVNTFCEPVARFADLDQEQDSSFVPATPETASSADNASWRSLPLERQHLATGISQPQGYGGKPEYEGTAFFTASDVDSFVEELSQPRFSHAFSGESVEQVLSQFYEQSFAIHEDVHSSQLAASTDTGTSSYSNDNSSFGSYDSPWSSSSRVKDVPVAGNLMNLKDIPNAKYLNSIYPQTMTANLIIGIISISPPRPIKTRRGANVELVEILAGDETKSGFGVNFWLSSSQLASEGDMRSVLGGLRPQDVVLMRSVALNSFREKVYGQSLRKEMTKIHLLYRSRIDKTDVGGWYNSASLALGGNVQIEKTARVREWVLRFVGNGPPVQRRGNASADMVGEILPPDTQ